MPELSFHYRPATSAEIELTTRQLLEHSSKALNMEVGFQPFGLLAYEGEILAGAVAGKVFFNWLHVDIMWVEHAYRRRGFGTKLMQMAEDKARKAGLDGVEVWTQNWQAPEFYRKLGYEELATLPDFAAGRSRHVFRHYFKQAARPSASGADSPALPDIIRSHVCSYFQLHGNTLPSSGIYDRLLPLFEKPLIEVTLEATGGNQVKAAQLLGINRNTLRKKIMDLGIRI